jgi:hypothetical protein
VRTGSVQVAGVYVEYDVPWALISPTTSIVFDIALALLALLNLGPEPDSMRYNRLQ